MVISVRLTDQELKQLDKIVEIEKKNCSKYVKITRTDMIKSAISELFYNEWKQGSLTEEEYYKLQM